MRRIPIANTPRQKLHFAADGRIDLRIDWNTVADAWFVDASRNGVVLMRGIRMVPGINLLPNEDAGLLLCSDASQNDVKPTYRSFIDGDTRLYYYTRAELLATLERFA